MKLKHITFSDIVFISLALLCILLGIVLIEFNKFDFHFTSTPLFFPTFTLSNVLFYLYLSVLSIVMLYYGIYAKQESPRAATFIWGFAALVLTYFANVFMANGIATTPFTPIDKHLLHVDQLLGVHTLKLMAWTHYHTSIRKLLNFAYESLVLQLLIIPFSLACLNARQRLRMFLNAQLATFLIGGMIYYFFPTTAPSGILHSPYFTHLQLDTSLRFYEVHHFLPVTSNKGGLIAFPSFHVVWAILLTYCTIKYKWIFYPLVVLNCFLVVSTVFLGWHYLVDAIAGGVLGFLGIYFGKICEIRSNHI